MILTPEAPRWRAELFVDMLAVPKRQSLRRALWDRLSRSGNQQKKSPCTLAWRRNHPSLLIRDEPTQGIRRRLKAEIHRLMCELAARGLGS